MSECFTDLDHHALHQLIQDFVNDLFGSDSFFDSAADNVLHFCRLREIFSGHKPLKKVLFSSVNLPNVEKRCNTLATYQDGVDPESEKWKEEFIFNAHWSQYLLCRVDPEIPLVIIISFDTHSILDHHHPMNSQQMAVIKADTINFDEISNVKRSNPITDFSSSDQVTNSINYVITTAIGLLLSLCVHIPIQLMISFALSPLLTHWATKTLLVLCMGAYPVSTLPSNELEHRNSNGHLSERQSNTIWTVELHGWPNTGYCAMMNFGVNSQQTFCLIVDTGSANTAVAAKQDPALGSYEYYDLNLSGEDFEEMGKSVTVTYSSGEWSGYLVQDKIGFAGGNFSMNAGVFSLITSSTEFFIEGAEWVGILGLAYKSLAKPDSSVGTVWESIRRANSLQDVFSLQLCPPKESTIFPGNFIKQGGSMTLGGVNDTLYQVGKPIYYTKIVKERYFNILLTNISVGDKKINMSCKEFNDDKTIVDSGTTDIYFPTDVFQEVKNSFSDFFRDGVPIDVPDEFWMGKQKLLWQSAHIEEIYQCFPTLYLSMAVDEDSTQEFSLAVVPQLYLRQIDVQAGEADPEVCPADSPCNAFTFGVKPRAQGTVIGGNAMLGYYTVFDRENGRVGFAESTCEYRSTETAPYITGPYKREPKDCANVIHPTRWDILTYFCGALTMLISTTMIVITCFVRIKRYSRKSTESLRNRMKKTRYKITVIKRACCKISDSNNDEGYASETVMLDTNPHTSLSHDLSDNEGSSNREMMVVSVANNIANVEIEETEMNETVTGEEERAEAAPKNKKRRKRRRKRNLPVMETTADHDDVLCIPSLNPSTAVSIPFNATTRANYANYFPESTFNNKLRSFTSASNV